MIELMILFMQCSGGINCYKSGDDPLSYWIIKSQKKYDDKAACFAKGSSDAVKILKRTKFQYAVVRCGEDSVMVDQEQHSFGEAL